MYTDYAARLDLETLTYVIVKITCGTNVWSKILPYRERTRKQAELLVEMLREMDNAATSTI
jgi:hypothetical protein